MCCDFWSENNISLPYDPPPFILYLATRSLLRFKSTLEVFALRKFRNVVCILIQISPFHQNSRTSLLLIKSILLLHLTLHYTFDKRHNSSNNNIQMNWKHPHIHMPKQLIATVHQFLSISWMAWQLLYKALHTYEKRPPNIPEQQKFCA